MRFVVLGAGAIGGVVGGRLAQHGHDVAARSHGARTTKPFAITGCASNRQTKPSRCAFRSSTALRESPGAAMTSCCWQPRHKTPKRRSTPSHRSRRPTLPIFCAQNSVANERMAAARFAKVYGVFVWCPADYLTPGNVQVWCAPKSGILHVGCYPSGSDALAEAVAAAFRDATFYAEAKPDIMRWKYRKLLSNLGNAVDALCGAAARGSGIAQRARREGVACLEAAGISFIADDEEDAARLEREVHPRTIGGAERRGGSSWQSLERRLGTIETDYLNGEIVRLGQQHGVPTPVNALLQYLVAARRARAASAWQRQSRQDFDRARSSTESTAVARAGRLRRDRSASRAASATRTPESQSPTNRRESSSVRRARRTRG